MEKRHLPLEMKLKRTHNIEGTFNSTMCERLQCSRRLVHELVRVGRILCLLFRSGRDLTPISRCKIPPFLEEEYSQM
jgi:hypothetical protein